MCIEWYIGRDGGKGERDTISTTHTHKHGKDNNSRTENNMYICTLSGMFEEMVERGKKITLIYTLVKQKLTLFATLLDSLDSG